MSVRVQNEAQFQRAVIDLAHLFHWKVAHFRAMKDARGVWRVPVQADGVGWPDLILVREIDGIGRLVVAELKIPPNKPRAEQIEWLRLFDSIPDCIARVWSPADWSGIVEVIDGRVFRNGVGE